MMVLKSQWRFCTVTAPPGVPFPTFPRTIHTLGTAPHHSQTGLLICGGVVSLSYTSRSCIKFSEGEWKPSFKLKKKRADHYSWASPLGTVLMGGEAGVPVEDMGKTTELLDETTGNSVMHFPLKYGEV